jgi:hypothetical protein
MSVWVDQGSQPSKPQAPCRCASLGTPELMSGEREHERLEWLGCSSQHSRRWERKNWFQLTTAGAAIWRHVTISGKKPGQECDVEQVTDS